MITIALAIVLAYAIIANWEWVVGLLLAATAVGVVGFAALVVLCWVQS